MLQPEQIRELHEIAKGIKNMDQTFGSGLLIPGAVKVNSSRQALVYNQVSQSKNLENPQIPRTVTGYEKMYGDRSTSYYKSEKEYEVIEKIRKFDTDSVYALIVREVGTNYHDLIYRTEIESFAESSGVRINNENIDAKTVGSKIEKDEIIFRSNSYDEDMNYRLGLNAQTIYMVDPAIVEDAFRISDTLAERLTVTEVNTYKIPKNTNDILLNLYGDNETYKAFPDIGEKIKNKLLCGRRRIDYNTAQYLLKSKNLRKEMFGDSMYYSEGTVIDIDIFANVSMDEIPEDNVNRQLLKYMKSIDQYWTNLYKSLHIIINTEGYTYSEQISITYARARDILSIGKYIKWDDDGSIFDHMVIFVTVVNSKKAIIGSKLVGRHGNKGVISEIVPENQMPMNEDGEYAEIIFSALSVIGRLNPSQLYEVELNWIVDEILAGDVDNRTKFNTLMDFLSICNPDQERLVRDFFGSLSDKEKVKFLKDITKDFVVFQPPSMAISFKNYSKLVEDFKPKKKKFTIQDDKGNIFNIQKKLIMADSYIYRLKHEPITKFSVRSKGTINPRTFLPIKSHAYSRGTALFNNQAIRIGNMEMDILNLCNDPSAINYFTRLYCTSVIGRREFAKLLDINIFTEELEIDMENPKSRVVDLFNATMLTCGMRLDYEYADIEPIEDKVMKDVREMDKTMIKIVFKEDYKPAWMKY
jgi:DNA-directed RNA polymerase beta subunit